MEAEIVNTDDINMVENENNESTQNTMQIELGDIIELIAPSNLAIHEITAYVSHLSSTRIVLTNVANLKQYQLNVNEDGMLTDESIRGIHLLDRSEEKGYARQNNLLPKTWVNIHFNGEIPVVITGEISNLEEDMIEIITYPELIPIYIDFHYQGLPENIPIEKIIIREKPASLKKVGSLSQIRDNLEEGEEYEVPDDEIASITFNETGESVITIPEAKEEQQNMREVLQDMYVDANSIVFGEELEEISQVIEVPVSEQRFGIDVQVNDMMDELLSTIPNSNRIKNVLDNIHNLIERFKELRQQFSKFDTNHNVYDVKRVGAHYKPLVDRISAFDTKLKWIVPVVSNSKKLYDLESIVPMPDVISEHSSALVSSINDSQSNYNKRNAGNTLTYSSLYNRIHNDFAPFDKPQDEDRCVGTASVLTNLDAIVDNLGDFASSVYSTSGLAKRRFVVQRYNLGMSRMEEVLMKSGKKIYTRTNMTPNDEICLKSLIMLPTPAVRFSRIHLPGTSIIDKAELHQNYLMMFRMFKSNVDIAPQVIDDLSKELDYDQIEGETKEELLTGIKEFLLDADEYSYPNDKLTAFLETIIPKTKTILKLFRKYMKNKMSVVDVVRQLEPFSIYLSDITYKQYQEIRYIVRDQIKDLKVQMEQKARDFSVIKNTKYNIDRIPNTVLRILSENTSLGDAFLNTYRLHEKHNNNAHLSPSELLTKIMEKDNGVLYSNMISSIMISLISPDNLMNLLNEPSLDDISDVEKIKEADCIQRYLAKKYTSTREIQKDNDVDELYFDSDYDDTPYHILEKYKDEQKKMAPELFMEYLIANLIEKYDIPKDYANTMAKILVVGKKPIEDGHYAILELRPMVVKGSDESSQRESDTIMKTYYYRRVKDNWVQDNDINEMAFVDTNTLFCNIGEKCLKNTNNKVCETSDETEHRIKTALKERMKGEFDERYALSVGEIEKELEDRITRHLKFMKRADILREIQLYKSNNLAYELGNYADKSDIVISPHMNLRDLILGEEDFQKKQYHICLFVEKYCRNPIIESLGEKQHWLYCKDTNVPIMPISLHELATTFTSGSDYTAMLERICANVGVLSDDGDAIVDKYSGFVLRKIDYTAEEGYDEAGFKITSHAIMEEDLGTAMLKQNATKNKRVFDSETSETIYNVLVAICSNIDIPTDQIESFVLRIANELMLKGILSESAYKKRSDAAVNKTGKALAPYSKYRDETTLFIIASVVIVAIQTAVPSFTSTKTFPGCVRSFGGFPLTGTEDTTGITYIACVLNKLKSSFSPWNAIQKYKVDKLSSRIQDVLDKFVLKMPEIDSQYTKKREYILLNPERAISEEHSISKWQHFLPPVVKYSIGRSLRGVGNDFKEDLMRLIKTGGTSQEASIAVLKGKIAQHGFAVIEAINTIVRDKDLLLKTTSELPFLENACCNENLEKTRPITYFNEQDNTIRLILQRAFSMIRMLKTITTFTRGNMLYHPLPTGIKHPDLPIGQLEENIYAAVIHYCNFDKKLPIPDNLKKICQEKPDNYQSTWPLMDKMEFMKKNGKKYGIDSLQSLMTIIRQKNMVSVDNNEPISKVEILKELIENFDRSNSSVIDSKLRDHLRNVLNTYDAGVMRETPTKELDNLTNYITRSNSQMYSQIMTFFQKQGRFSPSQFKSLNTFIRTINTWSLTSDQTSATYDNELYTYAQFMQNAIQNISKMYPAILVNNADFYKNVPKHWDLSPNHIVDVQNFINKYYEKLELYKNDPIVMKLLREVQANLGDITLFVQNIPVYSDIAREVIDVNGDTKQLRFHSLFGRSNIFLLITHCYYRAILEYVIMSDNDELIRTDVQVSKMNRREMIASDADESSKIETRGEGINETTIESDTALHEVQIITGDRPELKERVASLLYTFMQIEQENKAAVNISYDSIMKKVRRSREKEKAGFVAYLGKMSIQERSVENQFKKYKLGRWNIGQQKGLVSYDHQTYERERGEIVDQLNMEMEDGAIDLVSDMRRDIYNIEQEEQSDQEEEYNQEAYDIQGLGEDYMDGAYYEEDMDDDF